MMDPYHGKVILLVCLAFFDLTDFGSLVRSLTARQAILKTAHRQAEGDAGAQGQGGDAGRDDQSGLQEQPGSRIRSWVLQQVSKHRLPAALLQPQRARFSI